MHNLLNENECREIIKRFIEFSQPLSVVHPCNFGMDYKTELFPPEIVRRQDLINVIEDAIKGKHSHQELETWASDIICYYSIELDEPFASSIRSALNFLDIAWSLEDMGKPHTVKDFQEQVNLLKNAKPETE